MRLWAKFVVIIAVALGTQWCVERNAGWLDEAWFVVRIGLYSLVHGPYPNDPSLMAAADELKERQRERMFHMTRVAAGAGEF